MVGKLTTDEEETTSLQLSIMIVLHDKIWGRDGRFLDGHEVKEIVDEIFMERFKNKPFEVNGNALGQGVLKFAALLKKSYGFETERARNVSYAAYNSMPQLLALTTEMKRALVVKRGK